MYPYTAEAMQTSHLTTLHTLISTIQDQTGAQQVRRGLHFLVFSMQSSLRKQQSSSSSLPPVGLLSQSLLRVQGAPVPIKGNSRRASVHLHARMEALLHQGPQPGPREAAPRIGPEGDGEGLDVIHQRGQRFLRINCRKKQRGQIKF